MTGPSIEFDAVNLSLGGTRILENVSLQVKGGTVHALVGPNGGGKSSLVKTLLGLTPHQGTLRLHWPGNAPGTIGYVPQALVFDPGLPMTVEDFMGALCQNRPIVMGLSRAWRGRVLDALERVDMAGRRHRRMGELSGGERQRVLLAQALIPDPDLVVLDEPMAALDDAGVGVFESLLTHWRSRGATVLWIEHDLDAVRRQADRVSALNRGLRMDGPPGQVLSPEALVGLFSHARARAATPAVQEAA